RFLGIFTDPGQLVEERLPAFLLIELFRHFELDRAVVFHADAVLIAPAVPFPINALRRHGREISGSRAQALERGAMCGIDPLTTPPGIRAAGARSRPAEPPELSIRFPVHDKLARRGLLAAGVMGLAAVLSPRRSGAANRMK